MFKAVNERRKVAGQELLDISCLRLRRRIVKPFQGPEKLCVLSASMRDSAV
jgi:hypothetical protein